jgi:hypothetical protein
MVRKVMMYNYIPHRDKRTNYNKWRAVYLKELSIMFSILKDIVNDRYSNCKIDLETEQLFNRFCYMIFKNSSKHIPKWI